MKDPKQIFLAKLTAMVAVIEPAWRAETSERYRERVKRQVEDWAATLAGPQPIEYGRPTIPRSPEYVRMIASCPYTWEGYRAAEWQPNYEAAQRDAMAEVDNAKLHFTCKLSVKLANATKLRTDKPRLKGELNLGARITGFLEADYRKGDSFIVSLSMVRNVRYERGYNPYWQFPARFAKVKKDGVDYRGWSEKQMSESF